MEKENMTAKDWFEKGNEYRQQGLFGEAINAYKKSQELDPDGPAGTVIDLVNSILAYRNTDLINP